jgi:hypothetical protein
VVKVVGLTKEKLSLLKTKSGEGGGGGGAFFVGVVRVTGFACGAQ